MNCGSMSSDNYRVLYANSAGGMVKRAREAARQRQEEKIGDLLRALAQTKPAGRPSISADKWAEICGEVDRLRKEGRGVDEACMEAAKLYRNDLGKRLWGSIKTQYYSRKKRMPGKNMKF